MIAKDTFEVYAQHNEDIILAALLDGVKKGFYVDVGANHEAYHSVTKYFYERGWSGINIEPIRKLIQEFDKRRPRDVNLGIAIAQKQGKLVLREYPQQDGLSTLSEESMEEASKRELPHKDYDVEVDTLAHVLQKHKVKEIDFLKIDVEGYEFEVLASNDWKAYRPRVICIEANHKKNDWADYILDKGYKRVIFDGLNEYYLANEHLDFMDGYAERSALLLHNALREHHWGQWGQDEQDIKNLRAFTKKQDTHIKSQDQEIARLKQQIENMKLKNLPRRIKNKLAK